MFREEKNMFRNEKNMFRKKNKIRPEKSETCCWKAKPVPEREKHFLIKFYVPD
jgi:hypothetical protein